MGITGEMVRSVFSKTRSTKTTQSHIAKGNNVMDKKKWKTSVRAYLCGEEVLDSVIAEQDSASVNTSEATVTQSVFEEDIQSNEITCMKLDCEQNQKRIVDEETAAIRIQSAFRGFMVRHVRVREATGAKEGFLKGMESPSKESFATSIEVQTGNSVGVVSVIHENDHLFSNKHHQKPKSLAFRPKEDWDDSTVDSSVSKMRMQSRREAMTRRERALAYAFSQQLRICSKKKPIKSDGLETNMGWSWLERWMATRQPDSSSAEDCISKHQKEQPLNTLNTRAVLLKNKFLDVSFEEKESCGSNEVPVFNNGSKVIAKENKEGISKIPKNRLRATRNISRRKTVPAYQYLTEPAKAANKRDASKDNKRQKMKQSESNRETQCKDSPSPVCSPDHHLSCRNSKCDP